MNGNSAKKESHPGVLFFHIFFKAVAALYFLLAQRFFGLDDFVQNFIVLLVFLSCDFWVDKNVSGRYLAGLRWWNDNRDENEGWRFETLEEGQRQVLPHERVVFWSGLTSNVLAWVIFTFITLISFSKWEYLLICVIALMMGGSNVYGYFKCSSEARAAVRKLAQDAIVQATSSVIDTQVVGTRPSATV